MAVKIRLRRTGTRNLPSFRVVAADRRSPRDGRFLENLGWYDPKRAGVNFDVNVARVEHWLDNGAMISDTVKSLLKKARAGEKAEANLPPKLAEERRLGTEEEAPVVEEAKDVPEASEPEQAGADEASVAVAEAEEAPAVSAEPEPASEPTAEEKAD